MVVTLPFPDSSLMPNRAKGNHWGSTHAAKVAAREGAYYLTKQAMRGPMPDGYIPVSVMFCMPDKRKRDVDNLFAACKAQIDGMAQAMGVDDSRFKPILLDWMHGSKPGCVVYTFGAQIKMTLAL